MEPRARRTDYPMMVMPPFFDFLVIQKIDPSKNQLFWHFSEFLAILRPFCQDFGCILGSPGGHFSTFLIGEISSHVFIVLFFESKNEKSEKWVSTCKIRYIVRVAMLEKCENCLEKSSNFLLIFSPKLI